MALCFSGGRRKWINLSGWLSGSWTQRGFVASWKRLRPRSVRSLWTASRANPSLPLQTLGCFVHVALRPAETHEAKHEYDSNTISGSPVIEGFLTERLYMRNAVWIFEANEGAACTLPTAKARTRGVWTQGDSPFHLTITGCWQGHRVWVWALVKRIFRAPQQGRRAK